jgi:hypothetical protein
MKQPKKKDLTWRDRLALAIGGAFTTIYGYGQALRGRWIYTTWRGQATTAMFVMILGALFLLAAVFPWGRLTFLWEGTGRKEKGNCHH